MNTSEIGMTNYTPETTRRRFIQTGSAAFAGLTAAPLAAQEAPAQTALPRWRGFNLLHLFNSRGDGTPHRRMPVEDDFRWMADWGFDFVRLPMSYWNWVDSDHWETGKMRAGDVLKVNEYMLDVVDRTVEMGTKYGLHVNLNLHRAPGYCINRPELEPFNLWTDDDAEDAFNFHLELLARRYRYIPASQVSYNLINEAPKPGTRGMATRDEYIRICIRACKTIRAIVPDALVITDGLSVGREPVPEFLPLKIAQSVHAYTPGQVSHYRASWVDKDGTFPEPAWPMRISADNVWDRQRLEEMFAPWAEIARQGIGVHCGECGCYNKTPHTVFLAWFRDVMEILKEHGIGWALWNLRGTFGILDSGRTDIAYEDWHGHKLDRKLLDMLLEF
jgi:endoglucanase